MKTYRYTTRSPRGGSTLTEVLIAMIVLGVGAVSVMTLFPVAASRAIKANQITQSTILRYHAETAVGAADLAYVELFFGPNRRPGDGTNGPIIWAPGPDGQHDPAPRPPGTDDFPLFDLSFFRPQRFTLDDFRNLTAGGPVVDDFELILIDPLGFYRMGGDTTPIPESARLFGSFEQEVFNFPDGEPIVLPRVTGGHRGNNTNSAISHRLDDVQARALVTLPDQFSTLFDAEVENNGIDNVVLSSRVEANIMDEIASFIDGPNGSFVSVTLFDIDGNIHTRSVYGGPTPPAPQTPPPSPSSGRTVGFNPPLETFPGSGIPIQVERAVIQQQNSDFTWVISARMTNTGPTSAGPVEMDVAVFFKRAYSDADERLYHTEVLDSSSPTGGGGGGIETIYNKIRVHFAAGRKPSAKEGRYLFDTQNNRWYRIMEITRETGTILEMMLDQEVLDDDGSLRITCAFPRGVIDVYSIGPKTSVYNETPQVP